MRFYSSVLSKILRSTSAIILMVFSSLPAFSMDDGSDLVKKKAPHRALQGRMTDEASSALDQLQTAPFGENTRERFFNPKGIDDFEQRAYRTVDIGYSNLSRTKQYELGIPTAPVFHPYNMGENQAEYSAPAFTLNIKLPQYLPDFVPPALHRHLVGMNEQDIDTFIIVQDMPWENTNLLFRPHYYLDPHAPFDDGDIYRESFLTQVGLFSRDPNGPLLVKLKRPGQPVDQRQLENELITESDIVVHNGKGLISNELFTRYNRGGLITAKEQPLLDNLLLLDRARKGEVLSGEEVDKVRKLGWKAEFPNVFGNPMLVSSSATLPVIGFNLHESRVVFSLTKCGGRTAVVKHILLNPEDEAVFEEVLSNSKNLHELEISLKNPENNSRLSPSGRGIPEEFDFFKVLKSSSKVGLEQLLDEKDVSNKLQNTLAYILSTYPHSPSASLSMKQQKALLQKAKMIVLSTGRNPDTGSILEAYNELFGKDRDISQKLQYVLSYMETTHRVKKILDLSPIERERLFQTAKKLVLDSGVTLDTGAIKAAYKELYGENL